jgi:ABC-type polysaccharide/polyol phosphate transport system ATPase subunit
VSPAPAVSARNLTKLYRRASPGFQMRTLKSALLGRSGAAALADQPTIAALEDVSFEVARGEAFGIVGGNGSGKSTLLKLIAGILKPTTGTIATSGRVAALIELGAGFHPEISGRENIFINGAVLGLDRREIAARYDRIVEFSGLGDFLEEPVKNYSSGMYVRLGFAVAIHTDPEVLLVDEVLAVGDEAFAHRCLRRIEELLAAGRTVIFVSHALGLVEDLCDRVLWLEGGRIRESGAPRRVVDAYRQEVAEREGEEHREEKEAREREPREESPAEAPASESDEVLRWGSGAAEVTAVRLLDAAGSERYHFESGEAVTFEIRCRAGAAIDDFVFGVGLSTPRGIEVWGTNTDLDGLASAALAGEATARLACPALRLAPGEYLVDVAVHARDGAPYDYRRKLLAFTVTGAQGGAGVYFPEHRWSFAGGARFRDRDASAGAAPSTERERDR